jgi:hypothetical protein
MSAVAQALERGRTDVGTAEAGRQLPPNLAGGGMLASYQRTSAPAHQRTSAPARSTVVPSSSSITSIKMPSAYEPAIIRLWHVTAYPARPRLQASSPAIRSR